MQVPHPFRSPTTLGAWLIAVVCGFELIIVAVVGSAGISSLFGLEAGIIAISVIWLVGTARRRRGSTRA